MSTASGGISPAHDHSLISIKGIGPARRQLLEERLSIHTVHDLAASSAEAIEALFRSAGQSIPRAKATDWITQAGHLAKSIQPSPDVNQPSDSDRTPEQDSPTASVTPPEEVPPQETMSEDNSEAQPDRPEVTAAPTGPIALRICQIIVVQHPETDIPQVVTERDRSLPGPLLTEQPLQISVVFELDGLANLPLSPQASYNLQGFVKSLTYPHRITTLGESAPHFLAGHRPPYSALISASGLPSGLYRLQLLIAFQGISIPFGMHEIPRFQVV